MARKTDSDQLKLSPRSGKLIDRCLRDCHYRDDLIVTDYPLNLGQVPIVTFAHHPHDARSSCLAFLVQPQGMDADLGELRALGVPVAFIVGEVTWEMWSLRSDGPRMDHRIRVEEVEQFFHEKRSDLAPGSIFRAKMWARAEGARQLDFVDTGLLPLVEKEAGTRLRMLFEEMLGYSMDSLDLNPSSLTEADAHWLVRANFWLLAGKLMRDKSVPKFTRLDLNDVQCVFDRVAAHYGANRIRANGRLKALRGAAEMAAKFSSLRCISTETLGALYEEALLSPRTRKLWSVHRTPTYLVDYMLARMSSWMENEIGIENCRVFEPACGHSPFLVGAVRLLSDLLPQKVAQDRSARQKFLRSRIGGCDRDRFALEIARLSLTLADIPNPSRWKLDPVKDMYVGDYLARNIAASSVILANPPFEAVEISDKARASGDLRYARSGQAGELLRRIVDHSTPETLFGIVVPQTLLDGASFRKLRQSILDKIEIREIVTFPDNVFKFAKPETAIIFGKKLGHRSGGASNFKFRRIAKPDMDAFKYENRVPLGAELTKIDVLAHPRLQLLLPPLAEVWKAVESLPQLDEKAHVTIGFYFYPMADEKYPVGQVQFSEKKATGFYQGFRLAEGTPDTHLLPRLEWLNQTEEIIEWPCGGTSRGVSRVIINHVRAGGGKWRHKAFIDDVGRPTTEAFLLLTPQEANWSLELLWALANSPIANAFTLTNSAAKQIGVRLLKRLRVPVLKGQPVALIMAVREYLEAARKFSESNITSATRIIRKTKNSYAPKSPVHEQLDLGVVPLKRVDAVVDEDKLDEARDHLRALHWRVDAELLKLYALPANLERNLLDYFDGVPRIGVPFYQDRYIPLGFRESLRLDEFLKISDEWEQTDERRCELIEKKFRGQGRAVEEDVEFNQLQKLYDQRRAYRRWLLTGDSLDSLCGGSVE